MAENMSSEAILLALKIQSSDETTNEFTSAGIVPSDIATTKIKKNVLLLGITPEDFVKKYSSTEFDFDDLQKKFNDFCKDYNSDLQDNTPSKALEFSGKILFEYGPYMRTERKAKGDKAIRFRFPYQKRLSDGKITLSLKIVIVTTFKDITYTEPIVDGKLILTFRQAGLLAMVTFSKAIAYCYAKAQSKLLTPLCGAIFSRDSIEPMSQELKVEESECLKIINESSTSGGQYLPSSDIACAIVCMITSTKRVTDNEH